MVLEPPESKSSGKLLQMQIVVPSSSLQNQKFWVVVHGSVYLGPLVTVRVMILNHFPLAHVNSFSVQINLIRPPCLVIPNFKVSCTILKL